ncbi:hypothetical protein N0V95_005289 [Ascochyta clinopodiicola]|nr:hypothetical protein N0V95_005289 [Ascochyta clinopodiicola]
MSEYLLTKSAKSSQYDAGEELPSNLLAKPRKGFLHFIKCNVTIILAFVTGASCVGIVFWFTSWLSKQVLGCPHWAIDCNVPERVKMIKNNFGLAQETYLDASRGSIPASPFALLAARNLDSIFVVLSTLIITLSPLAAAPVIGQVYNRGNVSVEFLSETRSGGGIGPLYQQTNPPGVLREFSATTYTSWQSKLSSEPMPEHRDWFIDRRAWSERGNFTIETVKMQQDIDCRGWDATPTKKGKYFWFETEMNKDGKTQRSKASQHDEGVYVRDWPRLSVWTHSYTFLSPTKTIATVIFAAMNGTVDLGMLSSTMPDGMKVDSISSIACDIAVEFSEDTLVVGDGGPPVRVNTLKNLHDPKTSEKEVGNSTVWNELLLWFAVAPVANGANAYGAQPMYLFSKDWLPERFTSTDTGNNDGWTVDHIKNFIRVITGASLLGEAGKWPIGDPIQVPSYAFGPSLKMDPTRPIYLFVLPSIITTLGLLLLIWNLRMHRRQDIPIMRKATLGEMLKSSQTVDVFSAAALDKIDATESSGLNRLRVKFLRSEEGVWGLYDRKAAALYNS